MREVDGNTRILGIIGNPVRHTLSPKIHNFLAEKLGQDLIYVPFEVQGDISAAVKGAYELGIVGMNVTVPYKSAVLDVLAETEEEAVGIGAVNTLIRTERGYKGCNTDVTGLRREIKEAGVSLAGERVILIGAGGAARAAAMMCATDGVRELYILNRNIEKADNIAEAVRKYSRNAERVHIQTLRLDAYEEIPGRDWISFQCTSVGLFPHVDEVVLEAEGFYRKLKCAVDLIYTPKQTKYMQLAAREGIQTMNGSRMLVYQAIASYELWNETTVSQKVTEELLGMLTEEGLIG